MSRIKLYEDDPNLTVVTGACPHDCPDTCSWQVAVNQATGRAIDIWGHADHPVTAGMLCTKVDRYLERTYHPERLTSPLKRSGPKGSGEFTQVTWQQAMAEIAARLQRVAAEYGAEAILPYSYAGTMGVLQGDGLSERFFNRLGASRLARTICSSAGIEGYSYTMGAAVGLDAEAFAHADLILIWGSNTLTSNLHLWPFVLEARRKGARVIVIDPVRTRTARQADDWIAIRPGTDAALALAMMHVIIGEGLEDADYIARYTQGFDALAERVRVWTPARAAAVTGVEPERIVTLARIYAAASASAIRLNYGLQRHRGGGMAARTIACLPALTGAWRTPGGGAQLSSSGHFRNLDFRTVRRPDLLAGREPRTINMNRLGDALSLDPGHIAAAHYHPRPADPMPGPENAGPPVKALVVYNCNPAAVSPDQGAVLAGLARDDLFTVVLEHFQTDTADYADFVLPATTQLEHWDIVKSYGHLHLALNMPAIEPLADSLPNSEIFRRLAAAMGYDDACFEQSDEDALREFVESQNHPDFEGITWDALVERGFVRLPVPQRYAPFAEGNFPTPSGKCEFFSPRMAEDGYDPLPSFTEPCWRDAETTYTDANSDALVCISPPAHSFLNSSFVNVDRFQKREGRPCVYIHSSDAASRSIADGDVVRLWNDQGTVTLPALIDEGLAPGTVMAPGVWWSKLCPDGHGINRLTSQQEADMGAGACFYDVAVRVERAGVGTETEASARALAEASVSSTFPMGEGG